MGLSTTQCRPTWPYSVEGNGKHKGPTAEALKRAMKRAGYGFADTNLGDFDQHFNQKLESALDAWDPGNNGYGEGRYNRIRNLKVTSGPNAGQWALDSYALNLINAEWQNAQAPPPDKKTEIRKWITDFCNKGIANGQNWKWNYSQNRAVVVNVDPSGNVNSDCSGSVIQMYAYAKKKTGYNIADPAKQNWTGYGNTAYYECTHPVVTSGSYQVGDLAFYGGTKTNPGHVCCCMKAGDASTSDWWSFGSEPPSKRKLNYRTDFLYVVRPPLP